MARGGGKCQWSHRTARRHYGMLLPVEVGATTSIWHCIAACWETEVTIAVGGKQPNRPRQRYTCST